MKPSGLAGFIFGILVAATVWFVPFSGLPSAAQHCLALSLLAVIWWATNVTHPGYTSVLLLGAYVLLKVAPGNVVFGLWTTPIIYLVVGGYLIAAAVRDSGLGERIAFWYSSRYLSNYRSIIVSAYLLGFLLSFLIPHPWPRCFLIMSVMLMIIKTAEIPHDDAANIGLAVFAASCPTSAILLTGDSVINTIAVGMSGVELSWLGWLWQMGVPAIAATLLTLGLQLKLYTPTQEVQVDREHFRAKLAAKGPLSGDEWKCLMWVGLAVVLWATDSLHHIHPGWIALIVCVGLSLPKLGGVLNAKSWNDVPIATLFFLTAALAIGKVGAYTGMNEWLATTLLPEQLPHNPFLLAALITPGRHYRPYDSRQCPGGDGDHHPDLSGLKLYRAQSAGDRADGLYGSDHPLPAAVPSHEYAGRYQRRCRHLYRPASPAHRPATDGRHLCRYRWRHGPLVDGDGVAVIVNW